MKSFNIKTLHGHIMVEPWKGDRKIKSKISNGFASVLQKTNIVKLKVLVDAKVNYANSTLDIAEGSFILVSEELLLVSKQSLKTVTIEEGTQEYMLIDINNVIGVLG